MSPLLPSLPPFDECDNSDHVHGETQDLLLHKSSEEENSNANEINVYCISGTIFLEKNILD